MLDSSSLDCNVLEEEEEEEEVVVVEMSILILNVQFVAKLYLKVLKMNSDFILLPLILCVLFHIIPLLLIYSSPMDFYSPLGNLDQNVNPVDVLDSR